MSFFEGICRGKTYSLSASKVTCIAMAMAWCVVCQGVVCNTVTLVNFNGSFWVMRSWCRMVHSWSMVMRCRFVHVSIVRAVNPVVTTLVCYKYRRMCIVEMPSVVVRVHCECPAACLPCYRTFHLCSCIELVKYAEIPNYCDVKCLADGISSLMVLQ